MTDATKIEPSALSKYMEFGAHEEQDPVERLRAFCSFAMQGQDWLDVEPLFNDVVAAVAERDAEIERLRALVQDALRLCSGVAEQQAYPDDSWKAEATRIDAAIKGN